MKRWIPAVAIFLGSAAVAWAAQPAALTTLHAIHALSNEQASHALPVAFEATVTFYRRATMDLVVQDSGAAIYVYAATDARLVPGDRVLVRGVTKESFHPVVLSNDVTLLNHGDLPKPVAARFDEMVRGELDCKRVTVRAIVRGADLEFSAHQRITNLQLLMDGGYIEAFVSSSDANALKQLLDAEVEVTGVVTGLFDGKMQLTGAALNVPTLADVKILKRDGAGLESLPVIPIDQVLGSYHVRDFTSRVRVRGTITYYQPGAAIVLESGAKSLWIATLTDQPLSIGDLADASGFPDVSGGFITLTRGEIRDTHVQAPIAPRPIASRDLSSGRNAFDLVSTEGQVLMAVRQEAQDQYVLVSNGHLFSAIYRHPDGVDLADLPPMKQISAGSKVRVTGICMLYSSHPFSGPVAFDMLLRSSDDVTLLAMPSRLTPRNLMLLVGLTLFALFVVGARGWFIERKVRRQTATLAYIERRRRRILEDINGSRPLAEIIEEITELASFMLKGAPCWCQIADGALLGNCPQKLSALRIVQHEIPAHSGPPRGTVFAAFDPLTKPSAIELEALSMAAALATLGIETRRLYSDLLRRSEFDLLTDIHNRFSLDKRLDAQIAEARQQAGIFGLIYIDLDEFKMVNDLYGHQIGDLYLQEVALRMKRQLRSHDLLARLGGDEFAALVAVVPNRAGVEEIAVRLERCFDEPFAVEGFILRGSASVGIALYPEDGATKDSLLNAADAAMYIAKHTRRHVVEMEASTHEPRRASRHLQ
jgi:diguanylate cyclase (GGDEF)-like protein